MNRFITLSRLDGEKQWLCIFNLDHIERIECREDYSVVVLNGRQYDVNVREGIPQILQKIVEAGGAK